MKNYIILTAVLVFVMSCNGPKSGPLQKDAFNNEDLNQKMETANHGAQVTTEKIDVVIEPCDGCITISKLFADKKGFSGKVIRIKGKVTKYNPLIMGKNWVHIQDGTEYKDSFDLTLTTDSEVSVGDIVTFEGKIALDKDLGYGYFYEVLMEDAKPVI